MVLKLDFAKSFDSVNWDSLQKIMRTKGFLDLLCNWISSLLVTSRSAVLVNGVPGPWFSYKKGL